MSEQPLSPELDPGTVPLGVRIRNLLAVPGRILGVLVVPDRAMPAVVRDGRSGAALVTLVLAGLFSAYALGSRVDSTQTVLRQEAMTQKQQGPAYEARSDREIEEQIAKERSIAQLKIGLREVVFIPAVSLLLAIGTFLLGRFVGGRPSFSGSLSAVASSFLPVAVKSVVVGVVAWPQSILSPDEIDKLGRIAELAPAGGALSRIATVDVFALWCVLIYVFAFAAAAQVSRRKSLLTVLVCFALFQLLTAGFCGAASAPQMTPAGGPR